MSMYIEGGQMICLSLNTYIKCGEYYVLYYNTGGPFWCGVASFVMPTSPTCTTCGGVRFIADSGVHCGALWCRRKWKHGLKGHLTKKDLQMLHSHSQTFVYKLLTQTVFPTISYSAGKTFCCIYRQFIAIIRLVNSVYIIFVAEPTDQVHV